MQRGDECHGAGKGVRCDHQVMRLRQGGDAAAFGEAAGPRDVRLHDVDRAAGDQLAEAVEPDLGLVAGDRCGERIGDPRAAVDVVGRDRLLDPVELIGLERAAHFDRERRAPGAVDVDHQLRVRAQRAAYRRNPRDVLFGVGLAQLGMIDQMAQMGLRRRIAPDLHLHAVEAAGAVAFGLAGKIVDRLAFLVKAAAGIGLDPLAAAAEKAIERQPGDLAGDVPERDVDAADRIHDDAAAAKLSGAREHLLPQPLDQQRVLADQHRLQQLVDDVARSRSPARRSRSRRGDRRGAPACRRRCHRAGRTGRRGGSCGYRRSS